MKPVKKLVFAALLVFIIALNTLAGDIDQPGAPAPQPSPRMTATITDGTLEATDTPDITVETADYLFLEALAALLSAY